MKGVFRTIELEADGAAPEPSLSDPGGFGLFHGGNLMLNRLLHLLEGAHFDLTGKAAVWAITAPSRLHLRRGDDCIAWLQISPR